jgi:predicted phosphodiesterase
MDRRRFLQGAGAMAVGLAAQQLPRMPLAAAQSGTRLALVGDVGTGNTASRAVADAVSGSGAFDGLVLLGDNAYPDGDPRLLDETVFGPYDPVLRRARLCAVLGNQDVKDGNATGQMRALGMPGRWYSRTFGDLLLVCLDTNRVGSAAQRSWLESTLRSADQRWRVAAMHVPAYSAGKHGSSQQVRSAWSPLFEQYGVQLVVAGHDHNYQVSRPQSGVTYIVSGGGGGALYRARRASFTSELAVEHHFVELEAGGGGLRYSAVDRNGRQFDGGTISA